MAAEIPDGLDRRVAALVTEVATALGARAHELTVALAAALSDAIEDVRDGPLILDLLGASVESNLEMLADTLRYGIPIEEISTPAVAEEYARRLAQRGISLNALVRAYRLGQQHVVDWAFSEIAQREPDSRVAFAAGQRIVASTFNYIDRITEQIVDQYETELERWMATRNTVRSVTLEDLLGGRRIDASSAEASLGYRLRQNHLGVVLWSANHGPSGADLRQLERVVDGMSEAVGGIGAPLFFAKDRLTAWGWIGLGRKVEPVDTDGLSAALRSTGKDLFAAVGTPAASPPGFRTSHLEAVRAQQVALIAKEGARGLTSYADPQVRVAALLAADVEVARRMVDRALGALAADTDHADRLRDTLLTFLTAKGSYTATSELVHLHKNTVKYRVDKALEERARPLDDERLDLEFALIACRWLGRAVLTPPGP
ncbi:PucR family transcriptional regulator [Rhodococcus tukisamuensis]|uniref:DNA-binding transcriptional regulator, PucR family n=1 Tax=Rhodococcus tukisamuensis TaxID=168276 RepID=A0A1G6QDV7_9NOCA|nr:helix-turn-helix domain-containing protein [Rhodococcus tukisamuensis]SDC90569.1 DNA-binding transcriptional regulator, PucR family [Rhodococcus tukisamuensis]